MKKIDWQAAYGPAPDALRDLVAHALHEEEKPMKRKSVTTVLLAAILIIALAGAALAVAGRLGLLDMVYTYNPEGGDVSGMIASRIDQEGGDLQRAAVTVREAFYDGKMVHFLVGVEPKEDDTALVMEYGLQWEQSLEEAHAFGANILGVRCEAVIPGGMHKYGFDVIHGNALREEAGLAYGFTHTLPEGTSPQALEIRVQCTILDDEGEALEDGEIIFTLPRTAEPEAIDFPLDRDLESIHIDNIALTYTPLELTATIQYRPLWRVMPTFGLIGEDGLVQGMNISFVDFDPDTREELIRIVWAAPGALPEKLVLWVYDTDEVLVLYPHTGESKLHPASARISDEPPEVDMGMAYYGEYKMYVAYDEEVTI